MVDEQIIKALECCADEYIHSCDYCPFQERCVTGEFVETEALDLINRQKEEIERLKEQVNLWQEEASSVGCENEWLKACLKEKNAEIERLNRDYSTAVETMSESIRKANAEVERFKKIETTVNAFWSELQKITTFKKKGKPTLEELLEYMDNLKAEAIKEFAERLKVDAYKNALGEIIALESDIDNLVKEMVGEG